MFHAPAVRTGVAGGAGLLGSRDRSTGCGAALQADPAFALSVGQVQYPALFDCLAAFRRRFRPSRRATNAVSMPSCGGKAGLAQKTPSRSHQRKSSGTRTSKVTMDSATVIFINGLMSSPARPMAMISGLAW